MDLTTHSIPFAPAADLLPSGCCPFHDGISTLDAFLAELDPCETELFDAALDLRSVCQSGNDAGACVEQLFRVRALLGERHYLAFYRVRCWARRVLQISPTAQPRFSLVQR
jgi:hypothetical protein